MYFLLLLGISAACLTDLASAQCDLQAAMGCLAGFQQLAGSTDMAATCSQHLRSRRKRRTCWTRPWILRRQEHGAHHSLIKELSQEDHESYKNFVRMTKEDFTELLEKVSPLIVKKDTIMRKSISPAERLSLTLRYLATGESYKSLSYLYRIPVPTLSLIIPETCSAIYNSLKDEYMKVPSSQADWEKIAKEFEDTWNFPNCIGAMDGKHIAIRCPLKSGSNYYNYKQFYSIVLLALVDADYKFIYIDCGCNGRVSDGGVFANSTLFQTLESNTLHIPPGKPLPQRNTPVPFVIVGDEAFPLKSYLMKPYPSRNLDQNKRIFNYRLSRARRIVENVFGILTCRFGVFKQAIPLEPEKVERIVLACCALHNFLRTKKSSTEYLGPGMVDEEDIENGSVNFGTWRQEIGNDLPGLTQQSVFRQLSEGLFAYSPSWNMQLMKHSKGGGECTGPLQNCYKDAGIDTTGASMPEPSCEDAKTLQTCLKGLSTVCEGNYAYDQSKTSLQDVVSKCTSAGTQAFPSFVLILVAALMTFVKAF